MRDLWRLAPFRNAYLVRGAVAWVGVRFMAALAGVGDPGPLVELGVLAIVATVVWLDARRRNEDLFLANLGVPGWSLATLGGIGALPLELLVP